MACTFPPIDPEPLRKALVACAPTGLGGRIAERARRRPGVPDLPDPASQAGHLAALLDQARLDALANLLDPPLEETIAAVGRAEQLDDLAWLLRVMLTACAARDPDLAPGCWQRHVGETRAWAYRAMIDQSAGLDGMRLVRPAPGTSEARLDDGPDSTRAVRAGHVTGQSPDGRLYELICLFADALGTVDQDRPAPTDGEALARFCATVNHELFRHNHRDSHVFGLWAQGIREPAEVRDALLRRLPNLRLFECAASPASARASSRGPPRRCSGGPSWPRWCSRTASIRTCCGPWTTPPGSPMPSCAWRSGCGTSATTVN